MQARAGPREFRRSLSHCRPSLADSFSFSLEQEQKKCASGPLKVAERITVIALIKVGASRSRRSSPAADAFLSHLAQGKKLFGGKPVIVDCGSAGVFSY